MRDWLLPFRPELEKRATKQDWWELQQAQLAYQERFLARKIVYQDITAENPFALDGDGFLLANTCYFMPIDDLFLLGFLNSRLCWFCLAAETNIARGGYLRLRTEFVERLPIPVAGASGSAGIANLAQIGTDAARARVAIQSEVRHRILADLAPAGRTLTGKLENWHDLDFAAFRAEIEKAFRADIPLKQRKDWETYLAEHGATVRRLSAEIAAAEREIDTVVYRLFDLTAEEIALLEASINSSSRPTPNLPSRTRHGPLPHGDARRPGSTGRPIVSLEETKRASSHGRSGDSDDA